MSQARLYDMPDILRDAGLKVVLVPGWREFSRPASSGGFDPVGNLWHHTGAKDVNPLGIDDDFEYAKWLAKIGRSDLPAPLCQNSIARDGTIFVCAAGRGNHAGTARAQYHAGRLIVPAGDGNELYIGWECHNTGSEGWTPEQYDAMTRAGAATSEAYGWSAFANRAHRETSVTGKWDPGLLDMDRFRTDIHTLMEDDMADYAAQLDRIEKHAKRAAEQAERARRGSYKRDTQLIKLARETAKSADEILAELDADEK